MQSCREYELDHLINSNFLLCNNGEGSDGVAGEGRHGMGAGEGGGAQPCEKHQLIINEQILLGRPWCLESVSIWRRRVNPVRTRSRASCRSWRGC